MYRFLVMVAHSLDARGGARRGVEDMQTSGTAFEGCGSKHQTRLLGQHRQHMCGTWLQHMHSPVGHTTRYGRQPGGGQVVETGAQMFLGGHGVVGPPVQTRGSGLSAACCGFAVAVDTARAMTVLWGHYLGSSWLWTVFRLGPWPWFCACYVFVPGGFRAVCTVLGPRFSLTTRWRSDNQAWEADHP